ncbi:MAG TPA: DUF262 domain-containing protein, partial [Ktedonobacterales bacterium]|nr:DUF262 domain-containing protein [Ktedonobacterales bacterium]
MKVDNLSIADVFNNGGNIHYVLPHFQRQYTWERKEWQTLWEDALAVYEEYEPENPPEHFLGSLVVVDGGRAQGVIPVSTLVDGQQRLTTVSLMLCALRDYALSSDEQLANDIQSMLVNQGRSGDLYLKLLPTTKYNDRNTYRQIALRDGPPNKHSESGIAGASAFFRQELQHQIAQGGLDPLIFFQVLIQCLQVVFITLNRDESPYRIFESLNAKGKPLTQADLVRNYIAMKLPANQQEGVFKSEW